LVTSCKLLILRQLNGIFFSKNLEREMNLEIMPSALDVGQFAREK